MTKYSEEEVATILSRIAAGETKVEIAKSYGVTSTAIINMLKRRGVLPRVKPEFNESRFIELRERGFNYKIIAEELGVSEDRVKKEASRLIKLGILNSKQPMRGSSIEDWAPKLTEERMIELVKLHVSYESCPSTYSWQIKKYFGSWTKALEAARISGNIGGKFDPSKPTKLYFLDFGEFQKIGITQQQIKSRFSGAPPYTVLDVIETDLDNAIYLEREVKKVVTQFIPDHPWFERNGKTECFKTTATQIEDLF